MSFRDLQKVFSIYSLMVAFMLLTTLFVKGQERYSTLRGRLVDSMTRKPLGMLLVQVDNTKPVSSATDGSFVFEVGDGSHAVFFQGPGYLPKKIVAIEGYPGEVTELVVLMSHVKGTLSEDTGIAKGNRMGVYQVRFDSIMTHPSLASWRMLHHGDRYLTAVQMHPGIDRNGMMSVRRLDNVSAYEVYGKPAGSDVFVSGMGNRYNQVLLNGMPLQEMHPEQRIFPIALIPVEAMEESVVQWLPDALTPTDYSGGSIQVRLKDMPDRNFAYILAGTGVNNDFEAQPVLRESGLTSPWTSFTGGNLNLPSGFPTTRGRNTLSSLNVQERVRQMQRMENNLSAESSSNVWSDTKFLIGFGRRIALKKQRILGITGFLQQVKTEFSERTQVQAVPDAVANPYPFVNPSAAVVGSYASDLSGRYMSAFTGILNAVYQAGKTRISFRNLVINQYSQSVTERTSVFKPAEDTLSRHAIVNEAFRQFSWNTQLSGEHLLNASRNLILNWQGGYVYSSNSEPDQRQMLLMESDTEPGKFRVAQQRESSLLSPASRYVNSGRTWRTSEDQLFHANVSLNLGFKAFQLQQHLQGGIWLQSYKRELSTDLFHLSQQDGGYYAINELLAPSHYYPSGVMASSFFAPLETASLPFANDFSNLTNQGNYLGSTNIGAAYLQMHNWITPKLSLRWGIRAESVSQLVSSTQYQYREDFRNPQLYTISLNSRISKFNFLPSAKLTYNLMHWLDVYGGYGRTSQRPQMEELSRYQRFNPSMFMVQAGNPILESPDTDHAYGGIRLAGGRRTYLDASVFYKYIDRPIEYRLSLYGPGLLMRSPVNAPPAEVRGIQASFSLNMYSLSPTRFLSFITLYGSGTYNDATVRSGPVRGSTDLPEHSLAGVAEFSFQGGLVMDHPRFPNLSVQYQYTSDFLQTIGSGLPVALANGNLIRQYPDLRVADRSQLDLQLSQKFFQSRIQLAAGVHNILRSPYRLYQDLDGNNRFDDVLETRVENNGVFRIAGTDNVYVDVESRRNFYVTVSYLFR